MRNCIRLWIGLVVFLLPSCAARSPQSTVAGTQARVGSVLLQLEPTSALRPKLPEAARSQGIVGPVLVEVRISETGEVSVLGVVRGHPLLNELATTTVGRWKYPPTVLDGRVTPVIAIVVVSFDQGRDGTDAF